MRKFWAHAKTIHPWKNPKFLKKVLVWTIPGLLCLILFPVAGELLPHICEKLVEAVLEAVGEEVIT